MDTARSENLKHKCTRSVIVYEKSTARVCVLLSTGVGFSYTSIQGVFQVLPHKLSEGSRVIEWNHTYFLCFVNTGLQIYFFYSTHARYLYLVFIDFNTKNWKSEFARVIVQCSSLKTHFLIKCRMVFGIFRRQSKGISKIVGRMKLNVLEDDKTSDVISFALK